MLSKKRCLRTTYQSYHKYLNVRGNTEEFASSVLVKLLGGLQVWVLEKWEWLLSQKQKGGRDMSSVVIVRIHKVAKWYLYQGHFHFLKLLNSTNTRRF